MDELIVHSGVGHADDPPGRGSGRYSWGSGSNPYQHQFTFLSEVKNLKAQGISQADIAKMLLGEKATTTQLRAEIAIATKQERQANRARAIELYNKTGNVSEVGRLMGKNESSIRSLLDPVIAERTDRYENTANMLKKVINKKAYDSDGNFKHPIDVSNGTELYMGVTDSTKKVAIAMLEKEGYVKSWVQIPQVGTNHQTSVMVLAPPETTYGEIQKNKLNVESVQEFTPDTGKTWWTPEFPTSLDSSRVYIQYGENGGKEKDGVVEIRPGVEDLSLGDSKYAQVRIRVDDDKYMKGMAIYSDDIPEGYDIVYNTNKASGTPAEKVFKTMNKDANGNIDADNPFGALIKGPKEKDGVLSAGGQSYYTDVNGKTQLSPVNKLREEGDWDSWSRTLSSQFLAKQPLKLINQQINISIADKKAELEKINNLTNPVIKKKLLEDFANGCDANASDLSVKGFKNQAFQVLLPVSSMKDNEIYAPNYNDGDTVALVRYPHGGIFEIPVLKVNNKQADAKKIMENASDAVGINTKVAEQLSGADFDGDTALVIPIKSNRLNIASSKQLEGLKDFDPKESYKLPDDAPKMKSKTKQNEMGRVSNLITDMTVGGASPKEIEKAVKHSMVVIDAEKHHLDYKQSAKDNDIQSLKKKYQGVNEETGMVKGASTILSKAGAEVRINQRKEVQDTSKMTDVELERWNNGQKVYRDTGATKTILVTDTSKMTPSELALHQAGKKVYRDSGEYKQEKVSRMDTVDDAMDLVRDPSNQKEVAYAKYANTLKGLANEARKEARSIKPTPVSQSAKSTYANEVASLNAKLRVSQMNAPRERQAQTIANAMTSEKLKSNPDMDYEHRQREKSLALNKARAQVGAGKEKITITDKEWEAIQANAISTNKLTQILNNTDQEAFKQRATPKGSSTALTNAQLNLILAMSSSGMYTQKEIADRLGVSTSTVSKVIREN